MRMKLTQRPSAVQLHLHKIDIYRRTKNIQAVQLLLGHTKLESTILSLGIEVEDAFEMAKQTEV